MTNDYHECRRRTCHNCDHMSDRHHELDPLGEWKWCELWQKDVHEDDETCNEFNACVVVCNGAS